MKATADLLERRYHTNTHTLVSEDAVVVTMSSVSILLSMLDDGLVRV